MKHRQYKTSISSMCVLSIPVLSYYNLNLTDSNIDTVIRGIRR